MPFNFPDYGGREKKWECSSVLVVPIPPPRLDLVEENRRKVRRLILMQLYCYRLFMKCLVCFFNEIFNVKVSSFLLLLLSGSFRRVRLCCAHSEKEHGKHAKSNFPQKTLLRAALHITNFSTQRQWHVKRSPSPPRNNFPSQKHTKSFSFWEGHERGGEKIINYIPLLLHFIWSRIGVSPKAPPNLYQQSRFFRAFVQKCGRVRRIIKKFFARIRMWLNKEGIEFSG